MKPKLLIVVSAHEQAHFFPGGLDGWIAAQPVECRLADATRPEDFHRALATFAPRIVMGAWEMPALPLECLAGKGGSVEYFCFLAGSAKKQIGAAHLEAGLLLTNWGSWIGPYVAECALLLMLSALRRVAHWGHRLKAESLWREPQTGNRSLLRRRVGIHGFGSIARALVRLMQPFEPAVTTWDPWVGDAVLARYNVRRAASVEALFAKSEVLVELLPLTEQTERSVGEPLLRLLPRDACFINIGRGRVVDEAALIAVAREGRIQLALDVYAQEPLPADSPLRALPNVFLLPHIGGATIDRGADCGRRALRNIERYLAGEPVENRMDAAAFLRST